MRSFKVEVSMDKRHCQTTLKDIPCHLTKKRVSIVSSILVFKTQDESSPFPDCSKVSKAYCIIGAMPERRTDADSSFLRTLPSLVKFEHQPTNRETTQGQT
jgi:hypothetical protein